MLLRSKAKATAAFSLAEVVVTAAVCVIFGASAFAANSRLLIHLKQQKETAAATLVMQQVMEVLSRHRLHQLCRRQLCEGLHRQTPHRE